MIGEASSIGMAIGNVVELMHKRFPKHFRMGTACMGTTKTQGKNIRMNMESTCRLNYRSVRPTPRSRYSPKQGMNYLTNQKNILCMHYNERTNRVIFVFTRPAYMCSLHSTQPGEANH